MDQSDRSVGVDYLSIIGPNNPPWYYACSEGASLRIPVVAIEAGMDTSRNKGK